MDPDELRRRKDGVASDSRHVLQWNRRPECRLVVLPSSISSCPPASRAHPPPPPPPPPLGKRQETRGQMSVSRSLRLTALSHPSSGSGTTSGAHTPERRAVGTVHVHHPTPSVAGRLLADSPGGGGVQAAASSGPREIDLRTSPSDANADAGEVGAARLRRRRPLPPPPHRLLPAAPRQPLHLGLDDALLTHLCAAKTAGSPLSSLLGLGHCRLFNNPEATSQVIDAATTLARTTGLVLVDCSATYDTVSLLKDAVDHGCCIVLANKKPLTGAYEDFQKLVSNFRRIRFESTVGAGLPVIASVTRIIASGDPVSRIVGSLSGTLGYVMSELEEGKRFSEVVKTAKSLGYTEPDPRDDLGGMDVARKALILARLLGQQISMENINVESLYPRELGPDTTSTKDFLESGLEKLDKSMEEKVKAASSRGNVLRYVCEIESTGCQVGLKELPKDSAPGRLRESDNVVEIYSRCCQSSPLVIQGAGAGNDTTAAGVLADIIDLQDLFPKMA